MLSDEEKREYEELKSLLYKGTISQYGKRKLIDIIEKQSKEIEEYKKQLDLDNECEIALNSKVMDLEKEIEELKDTRSIFNMGRRSYKNEIEDKIKEILRIEEDIDSEKLLSLLQTIVDENARLEDIEDRKVQIEYNNVFNKGVKSVEDKIKAKIEELENEKEKYFEKQVIQHEIEVLQSLLEKE